MKGNTDPIKGHLEPTEILRVYSFSGMVKWGHLFFKIEPQDKSLALLGWIHYLETTPSLYQCAVSSNQAN